MSKKSINFEVYKITFFFIISIFLLSSISAGILIFKQPIEGSNIDSTTINTSGNQLISKDLRSDFQFQDGIVDWVELSNKIEFTTNTDDFSNYKVRVENNKVDLIIGFKSLLGLQSIKNSNYISLNNLKIIRTLDSINAMVIQVPFHLLEQIISHFKSYQEVRYVKPNNLYHVEGTPNDPSWSNQWGPERINVPQAWEIESGDLSEVLVCVIDTGIDYTHPDLSNQYVALGYDWVNGDADPMDDHSHGTHCAGTIAATINNSIGIVGVANVSIMAEKFLASDGYGSSIDAASSIIHAVDAGADILSNSWGGGPPDDSVQDALAYAAANDVVVIAAAGNDASSAPHYPASYPEAISVSATDSLDNLASFSNFGADVEVAAPGVDIYSTIPVSMGSYGYKSGTSMACPHVSGVAALIRSAFPSWNAERVRMRLHEAVDDIGDSGWDQYFGYGLTDAYLALLPPDEHDLTIALSAPSSSLISDPSLINITITNIGLNTEISIESQLWIDETLIDSEIIPSLAAENEYNYQYSWNPISYGSHNITVYVVPVIDEVSIENNRAHQSVLVSDLQNYQMTEGYDYNWIDITDGIILPLSDDDAEEIVLPFDFTFYDDVFTSLYVSSNGWFSFYNTYPSSLSNVIFPSTSTELYYSMALFWDDLYPSSNVYYKFLTEPNRVVVAFVDVNFYGGGLAGSFELILHETGEIIFQYDYISDAGSHSVGLNYGLDTNYYNSYTGLSSSTDDLAILFSTEAPDHELTVNLGNIPSIAYGDSFLVNATVTNRGSNIENDVELQLWIDDDLVTSEIYPFLAVDDSQTLEYLWTPLTLGTANVTAYVVPTFDEYLISNNRESKMVSIYDPNALKVAILNSDSSNEPTYWTGGWANNYQTLYDGLVAEGINTKLITNSEIITGGLSDVETLILIDNAPSDTASAIIKSWYFAGGNIISFDSSICFTNWAGILPPEAEGTNGYEVYWDYNSPTNGIIVDDHPIVAGYSIGDTITGASSDAQYFSSIMQSSLAGSYYTPVVKTAVDSDYDLISVYNPPTPQGSAVQIWDANHWVTVSNQLLILNTIYWLQNLGPQATVELTNPVSDVIVSGDQEISWVSDGFNIETLNYSLNLWNGSTSQWDSLVENITETTYLWDTTTVPDGDFYKIQIKACDGLLTVYNETETYFIVNNINEAPSVELLAPNGGEIVDDTIAISWNATDPDHDSLLFTLYYKEASGSWIEFRSIQDVSSYTWNLNSIPNGDYFIRVVVSDGSSTAEDSSDSYFTVIHENDAPIINILNPVARLQYSGDLNIEWSAFDYEDDSLIFTVYYWNEVNWIELASDLTTTNYVWDTTTVPNGLAYKIKVTASDGEFTDSDETDYFIINNETVTSQTTTLGFGLNLVIILLLTIAVLGTTGQILKRKK